jgi:hypothetical protein
MCNTRTGAATSCPYLPLRDSLLVQCQQTLMNTGRQSDAHKHFHISVENSDLQFVSTFCREQTVHAR